MTRPVLLAAAAGLLTFFVVAFILLTLPTLPDSDSYFHLAVARLYAEQGFVNELPWARYSVMREHYGDKEFLFHVLLMPIAHGDAATSGRLMIAALNGIIAALLVIIGIEFAGLHGAWLMPLVYLTAPYFWFRTIRLRPELLSVILLLALILAARRQRIVIAAVIACAYALSYTAFHVVATIAVLWMLLTKQWKLGAAILGGLAVGLLVHPHFPDNLTIWWLQNVRYFFVKSTLDVGSEIKPPHLAMLWHNAGWFLAAIALLVTRMRKPDAFIGVPAAIFSVLQIAMERMSIYFFPLASLVLLKRMRYFWLVMAIAIAASTPFTIASLHYLRTRVPPDLERDYAEFAKHIPPNAKIAARWGPTDTYVFYAPQGRYLDVLDPFFMAAKHPREYAAYRQLFESPDADVAKIAKESLDSDYIAFPKFEQSPQFLARLRAHPRVTIVYDGYNVLAKVD